MASYTDESKIKHNSKSFKKRKDVKWRIGDLVQYNSDPEDINDTMDDLETRQGVIKDYKPDNNQISIQRQDDHSISTYFLDDILIIYNITHKGHPKTTYGALRKHHKQIYDEQINHLKDEIAQNKQDKNKQAVKENREKLKALKSQQKTEQNEIKRQTRALRKNYDPEKDDKYENQHIEEKDCWQYRLPNMQQFIINIENDANKRTDKRLRNILNNYKTSKLDSSAAIQGIKDWIDDKMPNALPYATKPKEMSKIVSNLANNINEILSLILTDKEECDAICNRSYHHDLFEKIVLMKGNKGWKLRLHLFKEDNIKDIQEELHSHRNHFLSTCLYGSITQKVWEVVKTQKDDDEHGDGDHDDEKVYDEQYDGKNINHNGPIYLHKYTYDPIGDEHNRQFNIVKHEEKVKLVCVKQQTSKIGHMYYMHPSIIHQVVQCHGKTITLVLNSKTVMNKSCFGSYQKWHSQQFEREKFKNEELNHILKMAIKLIDN